MSSKRVERTRPLRVLFWSESLWPAIGGSEQFASVLIDGLRERGYEVEIVTRQLAPDDALSDDLSGVPVHRIPVDERVASEKDLAVILPARQRIAAVKKRFRPDLIHVSLPGPSLFVHRFTRQGVWQCPTLVSLHVPIEPTVSVFRRPAYETIEDAGWVTACSRALLDHARWMVPGIRGRCSVVYNGLPAPETAPDPCAADPCQIICVGRLVEQKGFATAIRALALLGPRHPRVRLRIVGDGPERGALERLAAETGVVARVEFSGWLDQAAVMAAISRAGSVLMPSEWEPFGLVALQAGQAMRPVVASRVDGLPEVVEDTVTGLLAEPGNAQEFARALTRLLEDPALAQRMGAAGAARAAERFSAARMIHAFDELYAKMVAGPRAAPDGEGRYAG